VFLFKQAWPALRRFSSPIWNYFVLNQAAAGPEVFYARLASLLLSVAAVIFIFDLGGFVKSRPSSIA
jgi:hypothetical protein